MYLDSLDFSDPCFLTLQAFGVSPLFWYFFLAVQLSVVSRCFSYCVLALQVSGVSQQSSYLCSRCAFIRSLTTFLILVFWLYQYSEPHDFSDFFFGFPITRIITKFLTLVFSLCKCPESHAFSDTFFLIVQIFVLSRLL